MSPLIALPDWAMALQARGLGSYTLYGGPGTIPALQAAPGYEFNLWSEFVPGATPPHHRDEGIIAFLIENTILPLETVSMYLTRLDKKQSTYVRVLPDPDGVTGDLTSIQAASIPILTIATDGLSEWWTTTEIVDVSFYGFVHCMRFSLHQEPGVRAALREFTGLRA